MYIKSSSNVPEMKCYESLWNRLRNSVLTSIMGDNTQFIQIHDRIARCGRAESCSLSESDMCPSAPISRSQTAQPRNKLEDQRKCRSRIMRMLVEQT